MVWCDDPDVSISCRQEGLVSTVLSSKKVSLRTGAEASVGLEHLNIGLDLGSLIPVEERWRRRLALVLARDRMEEDREVFVRQNRTAYVCVRDFVLCARLQVAPVEALVRELEDRLVRAEILHELDHPITRKVSICCPKW